MVVLAFKPKQQQPEVLKVGYVPHPKQEMFHNSMANELLFGGSAGPGKSRSIRADALDWCVRVPGLQVYLFRRTYPELEKNHIIPSQQEFPKQVGTYLSGARRWEFKNGAMLHFSHCQHEQDVFQYQGAEIHLLYIDELTTFTEFIYDYLRGRVRCTLDLDAINPNYRKKIPGIVCASNPGGVGHEFVKSRWVDYMEPNTCKRAPDIEGGMLRSYIPALLEDNPTLTQRDPGYINRLDALPEPYRTAYKTGDWNIFMGQAFEFSRKNHVIHPIPIPDHAPIYMTFDWGFGAPFSIGWWWTDADARLYRFAEWYGWNGQVNKGLRLSDPQIAIGIKEREEALGIAGRVISRYAGPDCFQKKPNYMGGGQGPSTAETFALHGVHIIPGDPKRPVKIRQFRERLRVTEGEMPMLLVYSTCEQFIRTIPTIQTDPNNVEDVDTRGEDHCLHGDTKVITDNGSMKIGDMVGTKGKVMTPSGFAPYTKCWLTRKNAATVKITFDDGQIVVCTPDHKFYTNVSGWIRAKDLLNETGYVSILDQTCQEELCELQPFQTQFKSSTEKDIISVGHTFKEWANASTGKYGKCIMGIFLKGYPYITEITTRAITRLRTFPSWIGQGINRIMDNLPIIATGPRVAILGPPNGMVLPRESNGTRNNIEKFAKTNYVNEWIKNVSGVEKFLKHYLFSRLVPENVRTSTDGVWESALRKENVSIAGKSFWPLSQLRENSVRKNAQLPIGGFKQKRVIAVEENSDCHDVYCLAIPSPHAFILEGGLISHNCYDEACHIVMGRPIRLSDPLPKKSYTEKRIDDLLSPKSTNYGYGDQDPYFVDPVMPGWGRQDSYEGDYSNAY